MIQFLVQGLEMCAPLFAMAGLSALTGGTNFYPHARLMKRLALRKTVFIRAKTAQCVLIQHESVTVGGIATSVERMNPLSPANIHAIRQTLSPVTTTHVFGYSRHVMLVLSLCVRMEATCTQTFAMESVTLISLTEKTRTVYLVKITVSAYSEHHVVMPILTVLKPLMR